MKKKWLLIIIILLFITGCNLKTNDSNRKNEKQSDIEIVEPVISDPNEDGNYDNTFKFGERGSADKIGGTTLIVSIFVNDNDTTWNKDKKEDKEMMEQTIEYIGVATTWLRRQVKAYNKDAIFVYDWSKYEDLYYETTFNESMVVSDLSKIGIQYNYIDNNIKTGALLNKYNADNIIYFFYYNTDYSNMNHSWTYQHNYRSDYEITNIFVRYENKFVLSASSYAHEILHSFGAPDLYYANKKIPQEYVDYLKDSKSKDILYTVNDVGPIYGEFTELDAYYLGLTDKSSDVIKWKLAENEYAN